jgi:hypothetical protein
VLVFARRHKVWSGVIALFAVFMLIGALSNAAAPVKPTPAADSSSRTAAPGSSPAPTPSPSPTGTPSVAPLFAQVRDGVPLPNRHLTPGSVFAEASESRVCVPGYSSTVRHVSDATRKAVFAAYHVDYATRTGYELDHLVPLELGGDNTTANLWPEPRTGAGAADVKDHLENHLHDLVCSRQIPLAEAQQAMRGDWWTANGKYSSIAVVSRPKPTPTRTATAVPTVPRLPGPRATAPTMLPSTSPSSPRPTPTSTTSTYSGGRVVHPGAFCSPAGATGQSSTGKAMTCGPASDGRNRWHSR